MDEVGRMEWAKVRLSLYADPKVRRLFTRHTEMEARAAMGLWLDVLLTSWQDEQRVDAASVAMELATCEPLVVALQGVKLLDDEGRIPSETWAKWWGSVEVRRQADKERQDRHRLSRTVTRDDSESHVTSPLLSSSLSLEGGESVREGEDPLLQAAVVALGQQSPTTKAMSWVDDMAGKYGEQATVTALMESHKQGGSIKVLGRAQGILDRAQLEATRSEKRRKEEEMDEATRHRSARQYAALEPSSEAKRAGRPLAEVMPEVAKILGKEAER